MFNKLYPYILLRMRSKGFVMALYFSAQDVGMMWLWNPVQRERGQGMLLIFTSTSHYSWDEGFDFVNFFQNGFFYYNQRRAFLDYLKRVGAYLGLFR